MARKADIAVVGLAVMGENLALNMESKGFNVAVYNRTTSKVDEFAKGRGAGKNFVPCRSIEELCDSLASPRKIMLMVKAGKPVDEFIDLIVPHRSPGDISHTHPSSPNGVTSFLYRKLLIASARHPLTQFRWG